MLVLFSSFPYLMCLLLRCRKARRGNVGKRGQRVGIQGRRELKKRNLGDGAVTLGHFVC